MIYNLRYQCIEVDSFRDIEVEISFKPRETVPLMIEDIVEAIELGPPTMVKAPLAGSDAEYEDTFEEVDERTVWLYITSISWSVREQALMVCYNEHEREEFKVE